MYVKKGLEPPADSAAAKPDSHYLIGRSEALLTKTDKAASDIVSAFSSPGFDTCLNDAKSVGVGIGNESSLYSAVPQIGVPYTAEGAGAEIPKVLTLQSRQIAIALSQRAGDKYPKENSNGDEITAGYRYVSILAMSAGKSLLVAVFQTDQQKLPSGLFDNVATAFVEKTTE